jgi:hypothetical protein
VSLFEKRVQFACLLACFLIIALSLIFIPPFWGLMDDTTLAYGLVPKMDSEGILTQAWKYGVGDISWGMFRPLYPLMAYALYKPGVLFSPVVTFALTALLSVILITGFSLAFARVLRLRWQEILLVNAAFFYQYDFLQHPSLQEKLIFLFGLGYFSIALFAPRKWLLPLTLFVATLGFLSKASFLIYFGAGFLLLAGRLLPEVKSRSVSALSVLGANLTLGLVAVFLLGKIAAQGSYTQQYDTAKILPNLLSIHGALFVIPLSAAAWMFLRKWRELLEQPQLLAPAAGLVLYLCIFLPWGIGGYIQSISGPLIAALICQLVAFYLPGKLGRAFFFGMSVFAVLVCTYRVTTMYTRLNTLGDIVSRWDEISPGSEALHLPCMEGTDAFRTFLEKAGHNNNKVIFEPNFSGKRSGVWLFDNAMCPLPGRVLDPPGCTQEFLYQPKWNKSYRVVRFTCAS